MSYLRKFGVSGALLLSLFIFSIAMLLNDGLRHKVRSLVAPPERTVLSVATGMILPDAPGRVVKLLTPEGVVIEAYGPINTEKQPLIDRIVLKNQRDAHMQFQGRATNLALKDLNGDRIFEIIAPSYDSRLIPHLNIFKLNLESKKYEPYIE